MEKKSTSAIHFRTKLLTAIYQMQSALGITDLGQFYHKPLKDSHGTVVLSCILNVKVRLNMLMAKSVILFGTLLFRNMNKVPISQLKFLVLPLNILNFSSTK